ncbi:hypothetical protein BJ741DRAFT_616489 [Chytriomyces cf. hyalinus JEL632]|nr:hypothetical protein BJ741DRAFT_616489 [Chytriomyces cf. hyalinus JEL632]
MIDSRSFPIRKFLASLFLFDRKRKVYPDPQKPTTTLNDPDPADLPILVAACDPASSIHTDLLSTDISPTDGGFASAVSQFDTPAGISSSSGSLPETRNIDAATQVNAIAPVLQQDSEREPERLSMYEILKLTLMGNPELAFVSLMRLMHAGHAGSFLPLPFYQDLSDGVRPGQIEPVTEESDQMVEYALTVTGAAGVKEEFTQIFQNLDYQINI